MKSEILDKIRSSALLVSLSLGSYNPVKMDKKESAKVAAANGVRNAKAARVTKNILPTAEVLDQIGKLDTRIRTVVEKFTAPFGRGIGLLPAAKFFDLRNEINPLFDERERLVKKLADDYVIYCDQAKRDLSGLYKEEDYPDVRLVVSRFYAKLDSMAIANPSDSRLNVMGEIADAIQESMASTMNEKLETVTPFVKESLLTPLLKMSAILQNPEHKLYQSTFDNAIQAAEQAEHLNLMDDEQIRNAAHEIKEYLNADKDLVKGDDFLRKRLLSDCNRILLSLDGEIPPPATTKKEKSKVEDDADVPMPVDVPTDNAEDYAPQPEAQPAKQPLPSYPVPDKVEGSTPDFDADAVLKKLGW